VQIWDNYVTGTRLRLRRIRVPLTKERIYKLTQKYAADPPDFSRTVITNIYLAPEEYEVLSVFEGNEIRKNRYRFEHEGRAYSIDIFLGALWGLVLAETSFETDEEMKEFAPPPFAVMDVTADEMFTGARLVELSIDDIRAEIKARMKDERNASMS
jgi:CYTH domain-containing protein